MINWIDFFCISIKGRLAPDFGSRKHSAAAKKQDALILNKGNVLAERAKVIDGTFNFL